MNLTFISNTVEDCHQSVSHLFRVGETNTVLKWMQSTMLTKEMVRHIWYESLRCDTTSLVFPFLYENYTNHIKELNHSLTDIEQLLYSPKAWSALQKEKLVPELSREQVQRIVTRWNQDQFKLAKSVIVRHSPEKRNVRYIQECANMFVSFLEHYVPSFLEKVQFFDIGNNKGLYSFAKQQPEHYGLVQHGSFFESRAAALASSPQVEMWTLAACVGQQRTILQHMAKKGTLNVWWKPILDKSLFVDSERAIDFKTSMVNCRMDPMPTNITLSYDLSNENGPRIHLEQTLKMADIQVEYFETLAFEQFES